MAELGFAIEAVDVRGAWPELQPLLLGIIEYHRPWDARTLRADWANGMLEYMASQTLTLLARNGSGEALGFISGTVGPEVAVFEGVVGHIDNVFVIEAARGQGVGQALLRRFEAWCREHAAGEVRLEVAGGNGLGLGFWRRSGYEVRELVMNKALETSE